MHFSAKNHVVVIFVRNTKLQRGKLNGMMKILHSLEHGNIRVTKMNLNYTRNLLSTKR